MPDTTITTDQANREIVMNALWSIKALVIAEKVKSIDINEPFPESWNRYLTALSITMLFGKEAPQSAVIQLLKESALLSTEQAAAIVEYFTGENPLPKA